MTNMLMPMGLIEYAIPAKANERKIILSLFFLKIKNNEPIKHRINNGSVCPNPAIWFNCGLKANSEAATREYFSLKNFLLKRYITKMLTVDTPMPNNLIT